MNKYTLSEIRKEFLEFFKKKDHNIVPSSPLVPTNDNSLLFTNAGMVQFKNIFTGIGELPKNQKAVSSQKCVRAGGKHNDLENVGFTKRHHTFFEMLGNFSFGDYFKENAIEMAWELITKNFAIDPSKLIVTVYHNDQEAFELWKKISSLNERKIIKIASKDNFWEMGDSGPCGPCSEIFYDHGVQYKGDIPGKGDEGDRFVEIWNLVFMQFNKKMDGTKETLPKPSIDTGMGIERIAAVLQGTPDNYEVDLFKNLISNISKLINVSENDTNKITLRIISDHLRAACFLISDGVLPSNEGRGYVLRRILRRAIRQLYTLGIKEPIMYRLPSFLIKEMGDHYNELLIYKDLIEKNIKLEETRFLETLDKGLKILEEETKKNYNKIHFSGKIAFKLYDTYGFPLDLTEDVLKSKKMKVNLNEFKKAMQEQKTLSKSSWKGNSNSLDEINWQTTLKDIGSTKFIGYKETSGKAEIKKILVENKEVDFFNENDGKASIILSQTVFYAESGGQVGDEGFIKSQDFIFEVKDTQKRGDEIFEHVGILTQGFVKNGDKVDLEVNKKIRKKIAANHSATHLLHSALRNHLGKHVSQRGSLVAPNKLRFDISHNEIIPRNLLNKVENEVNEQIQLNTSVKQSTLKKEQALKKGAIAIFGEKYKDIVRVIEIGTETTNKNKAYSIELCGGTHVNHTGEIGLFKIVSEGSLAAGVRRIEAIVGNVAIEKFQNFEKNLSDLSQILKTNQKLITEKVVKLIEDKKKLERNLKTLEDSEAGDKKLDFKEYQTALCKVFFAITKNKNTKSLKNIMDNMLKGSEEKIVILISKDESKVTSIIGVTEKISNKISAVVLIKEISSFLGGKGGGGRPTLAQGGGNLPEKADEAINKIITFIKMQS